MPKAAAVKAPAVPRRVLNERQAAVYTGYSTSFLSKARSQGNLPGRTPAPKHIKFSGGKVGYDVADLDAWIDQFKAGQQ